MSGIVTCNSANRRRSQFGTDTNPSDPELRLKLNRESQFTFTGQAERLLPPVFRALAERQYVENGQNGVK